MTKEIIIKRLSLIKHLYSVGLEQSEQSEIIAYSSIMLFHDSIDMFMQLAAEKKGIKKKVKAEIKLGVSAENSQIQVIGTKQERQKVLSALEAAYKGDSFFIPKQIAPLAIVALLLTGNFVLSYFKPGNIFENTVIFSAVNSLLILFFGIYFYKRPHIFLKYDFFDSIKMFYFLYYLTKNKLKTVLISIQNKEILAEI